MDITLNWALDNNGLLNFISISAKVNRECQKKYYVATVYVKLPLFQG